MPDGVEIKFDLPPFKAALDALGDDMERKIVRAATRDAANVFLAKAIAFAPVLKSPRKNRFIGQLKRALYIFRSKDSTRGREHFVVGVHQGGKSKRGTVDAFYWRFVERGHLKRGRGQALRGGKRSRALQRNRLRASGSPFVPAIPFLAPAFATGKEAALKAFTDQIQAGLDKANRRK